MLVYVQLYHEFAHTDVLGHHPLCIRHIICVRTFRKGSFWPPFVFSLPVILLRRPFLRSSLISFFVAFSLGI